MINILKTDRAKRAVISTFFALFLSTEPGFSTPCSVQLTEGDLTVLSREVPLFSYRYEPLENPKGGDKFKGSNFIHPLKTPSGFCITDLQPGDHLHHFGLWWPWKKIKVDGREIITWELQKGEGLIQAQRARPIEEGFIAESDYIDRTAPGGALVVLKEEAQVTVADFKTETAEGYYLDVEIVHRCATEHPVEVVKYRYSGFSIRATSAWNKDTSLILTSEGKGRNEANFTRAVWVKAEGVAGEGKTAGFLMMGAPTNFGHPELLRTWDSQHNGAVFANFNPVQEASWHFEPGRDYLRRYRVFVYDGELTKEQADRLWKRYSDET
jgi:hypothetical protein